MTDRTIQLIAAALQGIRFPAQTWEILSWADYNGVDAQTRHALWALPPGEYRGVAEIASAVTAAEHRGQTRR